MVYITNSDGRIVAYNLKNSQEVLKALMDRECYALSLVSIHESMKERIEFRCRLCGFKIEEEVINIQSSKPVWEIWTGSSRMDTR